jgi:hypothetical protein
MLGDYCWFLIRETKGDYKRQSTSAQYFIWLLFSFHWHVTIV